MNSQKQLLVGLTADNFRHSLDLEATNTLKQLPGFDILIRSVLGSVGEQFFYLNNIASSVLVGKNQLPDLHNLLLEACTVLDLEPPQLYIQQNSVPNAYTFAMRGEKPFIVLHTSLIEMLTPEEVQAVIAHELGHLKCEHGVYLTMANVMVLAANLLPAWGAMLTQSLQERILQWVRCAEFSCDRAALLATQNPRTIMSVLMKLAGGSPTIAPQLNLDAFIEQAKAYDKASKNSLGETIRAMQTSQLSHPVPVIRAREIERWAGSAQYQNLIQQHNEGSSKVGKWRNW